AAHFYIIIRKSDMLLIQDLHIHIKTDLPFQILVAESPDIIVIFHVKGLVHFPVGLSHLTKPPVVSDKTWFHRFRQPDKSRFYLFYRFPCLDPEFHRDKRRHVTAISVGDFGPLTESFDLIIPEV